MANFKRSEEDPAEEFVLDHEKVKALLIELEQIADNLRQPFDVERYNFALNQLADDYEQDGDLGTT